MNTDKPIGAELRAALLPAPDEPLLGEDAPLADRFLQLLKCLGEEVEQLRGEKARLLEQNDLLQASLLCFADRRFKN
jgi:hypothetical protein